MTRDLCARAARRAPREANGKHPDCNGHKLLIKDSKEDYLVNAHMRDREKG